MGLSLNRCTVETSIGWKHVLSEAFEFPAEDYPLSLSLNEWSGLMMNIDNDARVSPWELHL